MGVQADLSLRVGHILSCMFTMVRRHWSRADMEPVETAALIILLISKTTVSNMHYQLPIIFTCLFPAQLSRDDLKSSIILYLLIR